MIKSAQSNPLSQQALFNGGGMRVDVADLDAIASEYSGTLHKSAGANAMRKRANAIHRANPGMSMREAWSIVDPEGTLRKQFGNRFTSAPTLPPESNNNAWTDADYTRAGASHDRAVFQDEGTQCPMTEHVGGHTDHTIGPQNPTTQAAIDAINWYARIDEIADDVEGREAAVGAIKMALTWPQRW